MADIITFVTSGQALESSGLNAIFKQASLQATSADVRWIDGGKAAELPWTGDFDIAALRAVLAPHRIDVFITPSGNRRKKLLLADMDSTIVTTETLDELAGFAGLQDQIAAITERAMRGELDFKAALKERVKMLQGLNKKFLQQTLEGTKLMPGAATLVKTMAAHGAICVLVSGGFTFFTGPVAEQAGFHRHHGNTLLLENDALTGIVAEPILDKTAKLEFLHRYCAELGITTDEAMTIGDGANDLPMLQAAGFGVGYHPKPVVRDEIGNCILYGDLTAALYAQGYTAKDFVV
jgi:phosphoserine phosphatase